MFKRIEEKEIREAADLAWELSKRPEKASYHLPKSREQLEDEFRRSLIRDDYELFGYYEDEKLTAVINFYIINQDEYLQTTSLYVDSKYNDVLNEFICIIRKEYQGYEAYFGFTKENTEAQNYFLSNGFECVDSCNDMRFMRKDFKPVEEADNMVRIAEENFNLYAPFHDEHFNKGYWTSSRLREKLDEWYIFAYKPYNKMAGSIFIRLERGCIAEIFGTYLSEQYDNEKNREALLSYSLDKCLNENREVKQVVFFIDDDENMHEAAEKVGFKYYSSYRCYKGRL